MQFLLRESNDKTSFAHNTPFREVCLFSFFFVPRRTPSICWLLHGIKFHGHTLDNASPGEIFILFLFPGVFIDNACFSYTSRNVRPSVFQQKMFCRGKSRKKTIFPELFEQRNMVYSQEVYALFHQNCLEGLVAMQLSQKQKKSSFPHVFVILLIYYGPCHGSHLDSPFGGIFSTFR